MAGFDGTVLVDWGPGRLSLLGQSLVCRVAMVTVRLLDLQTATVTHVHIHWSGFETRQTKSLGSEPYKGQVQV